MGTIMAVCVSPRKGTPKTNIGTARLIAGWGLEHDSYAGSRHRQVSLLSYEKIEAFRARGAEVEFGAFGENLVVRGFDFAALPVGARFACGDVVLEMTRIGRECHSHCAIFEKMGECMMPTQGVFARVLCGGPLSVGDELELLPAGTPLSYRVAVLTASDKGSRGERVDESGALIAQMCEQAGMLVTRTVLLPDERDRLAAAMRELCDGGGCDLLLTTGGTGFAPRDCTPEATRDIAERMVPGIPAAMVANSLQYTPRAMLTRAVAAIRAKTLIVNLPGSPKAVQENLSFLLPALGHGLQMLRGEGGACARPMKEAVPIK